MREWRLFRANDDDAPATRTGCARADDAVIGIFLISLFLTLIASRVVVFVLPPASDSSSSSSSKKFCSKKSALLLLSNPPFFYCIWYENLLFFCTQSICTRKRMIRTTLHNSTQCVKWCVLISAGDLLILSAKPNIIKNIALLSAFSLRRLHASLCWSAIQHEAAAAAADENPNCAASQ